MEQKVYNVFNTQDGQSLIEIGKKQIDGKNYAFMLQQKSPYSMFVAEVDENNNVSFIEEKIRAYKLLKIASEDNQIKENFKTLLENFFKD